jgi:hypothetical protein
LLLMVLLLLHSLLTTMASQPALLSTLAAQLCQQCHPSTGVAAVGVAAGNAHSHWLTASIAAAAAAAQH